MELGKETHAKSNRKRLKVITLLSKVTLEVGRYLGYGREVGTPMCRGRFGMGRTKVGT
jgi:hypothetical protein